MNALDLRLIDQRSDEWRMSRLGLVTASRVADVIAKTKTGVSASRSTYMAELITEILTGQPSPSFTNAAMEWGIQTEPQARAAYEAAHGKEVAEVGLVLHPRIIGSAASPDGLVDWDGLIEIKCPNTSTHIDTLLSGKVPSKYITQMQWQMACTERDWCDFVSFDPRLPENLRIFTRRVPRDDAFIALVEAEVEEFLAEMAAKIKSLNDL